MSLSWQTFRIFISNTYNDIHAERDYPIKRVFLGPWELCKEFEIYLIDIDLRRGITKADAKNKCIKQVFVNWIDEFLAFFLCFQGQSRVLEKNEIFFIRFARFFVT